MPDTRTVDVAIPVEAEVAAALSDEATRSLAGGLVSRMLQPARVEHRGQAIAALKAEAHRRGLTDTIMDEELAAYNAERRDPPPAA